MAELIRSRKQDLLHIQGYLYYKHSGANDRKYWNCRNKGECDARAITTGYGENLVLVKGPRESPHNHSPNQEAVQALKVVDRIKRAADDHPEMPPAQILRRQLRDVPSEILAEMPDRLNLRKQISRTRLKNLPPNPVNISDLQDIPVQYQQTLSGSKFLLYDSLDDDDDDDSDRILIFATADNLVQLFKCGVWFVDGTFKTAPSLFFQLFSILGAVQQTGINRTTQTIGLPFVHALLENKRQSSYTKVFNIVLQEANKLGLYNLPDRIMTDFELSIINAASEVFGEDTVKCCFFHLCQNMFRHIVDEGLQQLYNGDDRCIKKKVHSLCSLAFVPLDQVQRHFHELRDELPIELDPIADYFEATYIRRRAARRRSGNRIRFVGMPPRFRPQLWNHYESVLDGTARTNNLSEGWHNRFSVVVGKQHPSLYVFFDELRKEQADTEIMQRQLQLGQRIRKGLGKKRREIEEQIRDIVGRYHEFLNRDDILTYLETVGYHVKF